jgi:hypothetical protein
VEPAPEPTVAEQGGPAAQAGAELGRAKECVLGTFLLKGGFSAELRDAVFDVVERHFKNVQLPVPKIRFFLLQTFPTDNTGAEFAVDLKPHLFTLFARMMRILVHPMLKTVDDRDPSQNKNNILEMRFRRTLRVRLIVKNSKAFSNRTPKSIEKI